MNNIYNRVERCYGCTENDRDCDPMYHTETKIQLCWYWANNKGVVVKDSYTELPMHAPRPDGTCEVCNVAREECLAFKIYGIDCLGWKHTNQIYKNSN